MLFERIPKFLRLSVFRLHQNILRQFCIPSYNKDFGYFRLTPEYKNSVVQLSNDQGTEVDFSIVLKEYNIQIDSFSYLQQRENVMKLSSAQIKEILCLMANIQIDTSKYAVPLKYLDEKCALSVERWPMDLSFYILDAWFIILGPKIFRKYYYSAIKSQWGRKMKKCSKFNLILMLYFIGMSKLPPPFLMEMIEDRMESFATDFSDKEYAIACLSFFKTSKKLKSNIILQQACIAAANLLSKNDRFNVISILKCLRLSKYYDEQLWNVLQDYSLHEYTSFNFVECTNFLAIFASQNIYNEKLFFTLENQSILALHEEEKHLKKEDISNLKLHPSKRSRIKDYARFLWALSSMGHELSESTINMMNRSLTSKLELGEFQHQMNALIDILQSFVLLGFYPKGIVMKALNQFSFDIILGQDKAKPKYQLYFVQNSTKIECPNFSIKESISKFNNPIPKSLEKEINDRKGFTDLINYLKKCSDIEFKCCYLIPHIMVAGIILSANSDGEELNNNTYEKYFTGGILWRHAKDIFKDNKKYVCLEVLDDSMCAKNSLIPLGLMKTKIRQLKCLNFKVVPLLPENIAHLIGNNEPNDFRNIKKLFD